MLDIGPTFLSLVSLKLKCERSGCSSPDRWFNEARTRKQIVVLHLDKYVNLIRTFIYAIRNWRMSFRLIEIPRRMVHLRNSPELSNL